MEKRRLLEEAGIPVLVIAEIMILKGETRSNSAGQREGPMGQAEIVEIPGSKGDPIARRTVLSIRS